MRILLTRFPYRTTLVIPGADAHAFSLAHKIAGDYLAMGTLAHVSLPEITKGRALCVVLSVEAVVGDRGRASNAVAAYRLYDAAREQVALSGRDYTLEEVVA